MKTIARHILFSVLPIALAAAFARNANAQTAHLDSVRPFDWDKVFHFSLERLPMEVPTRPRTAELRLIAVGDIMLGSDFPNESYLPPQDAPDLLLRAADSLLALGDVTFGNLEGAFRNGGAPRKQCKDESRCYLFRMPTRYARALKNARFTHLSMANNHSADFGLEAQRVTMRLLDSLDIAYAGLLAAPTAIRIVNGLKVGLCAFAPNFGAVPLNDYATARSIVRTLASQCDIVIASCHMGAEGSSATRVTRKQELFYGENRGNPYEIARMLIDAGADAVIGHGPHVPRALDIYKGRIIAYSLGNFCTHGKINIAGINGYAPLLEVELNADGTFLQGKIHSFVQLKNVGLQKDSSKRAAKFMRDATRVDIPETSLRISPDGQLSAE